MSNDNDRSIPVSVHIENHMKISLWRDRLDRVKEEYRVAGRLVYEDEDSMVVSPVRDSRGDQHAK